MPDLYSIRLYREMPETRRFHRWVLRRTTRLAIVYAGAVTKLEWERSINHPSRLAVTAKDPSDALLEMNHV